MATTAKIAKEAKAPKYKIRLRNRCRLCFRKLALEGDITGVTKSSW